MNNNNENNSSNEGLLWILGGLATITIAAMLIDNENPSSNRGRPKGSKNKIRTITLTGQDAEPRVIAIKEEIGPVHKSEISTAIKNERQKSLPRQFTFPPYKPASLSSGNNTGPQHTGTRNIDDNQLDTRKYPEEYYHLSSLNKWKYRKCVQGDPRFGSKC